MTQLSTFEVFVQAFLAVFMIVNPIDPVKIIIFNRVVLEQNLNRTAAAVKVALIVFGILMVASLIGRELLQLLGINLGAFGVVGGVIVAGMGFEMLYGGKSSRTQGVKEVEELEETDPEAEGLVLPLATPLMAGPGGITTVITLAASNKAGIDGVWPTVVAVALVCICVVIGFALLGGFFARLSTSATAMLARIGGLILATIGVQLALGGLRTFYGF